MKMRFAPVAPVCCKSLKSLARRFQARRFFEKRAGPLQVVEIIGCAGSAPVAPVQPPMVLRPLKGATYLPPHAPTRVRGKPSRLSFGFPLTKQEPDRYEVVS